MPKGYHHLTYEQRCQIFALKRSGMSQNQISKELKITQATISRELNRNRGRKGYRYKQAHRIAVERRQKASSVARKMTPEFITFMERLIREQKMSPEQISGRLKMLRCAETSYESIYRYIWKDKKDGGNLYKNLRQKGKKRNKRGSKKAGRGLIPGRIGIEMRPKEVDSKKRVGDWEGDTIVGKNHSGAIVSMVERKTKLVRLHLLKRATAKATSHATVKSLKSLQEHVLTITTDNGKEFAGHKNMSSQLETQFYFANPYHSWERGLNENTNGLVRQFFPKGTDFTKLTQKQVRMVEENLNNRPRKTLKFNTPNEEFFRLTGTLPGYALQC